MADYTSIIWSITNSRGSIFLTREVHHILGSEHVQSDKLLASTPQFEQSVTVAGPH